jgi:hypothetical protein
MPLLSTKFEFNQWYLEQLPTALQTEAKNLLQSQEDKIEKLQTDDFTKQYYIAMGYNVPCSISYSLPATVYVIELRAGKPVHPTLRKIAHKMHYYLNNKYPDLLLHTDLDLDDWDVRRGSQDISKK